MYIFFLIHCQDGHNILPEEDYFTCLAGYNTDFIFSRVIQLSQRSPGLAVTSQVPAPGSPRCACEIALAQVERKDTAGFPPALVYGVFVTMPLSLVCHSRTQRLFIPTLISDVPMQTPWIHLSMECWLTASQVHLPSSFTPCTLQFHPGYIPPCCEQEHHVRESRQHIWDLFSYSLINRLITSAKKKKFNWCDTLHCWQAHTK